MPGISPYSEEEEMRKEKSIVWGIIVLLVVASMLLASCAPATPAATEAPPATEAMTEAPTEAATEASATEAATEVAATEPAIDRNYSPDIPDPTEPVTIRFASFNDLETPFWQGMRDEFEAVHPNINVEFEVVPGDGLYEKLLTEVAGNPPDVAYVSDWMTGDFVQQGALVALDDYIAKSNMIDVNDYVPAFLEPTQTDGVQYGLPITSETTGLFYRTDRFEEVGLDPNKPPTTWEEFEEYAAKLTNADEGKYGFAVFAPNDEAAYNFYPWLWQAGGEQLNPEDPNDIIWDSPEGQKAADFYVNLAQYSSPDLLNASAWDARVPFGEGDVAMMFAGGWLVGELMTQFPDATGKWAVAPLPQDKRCATTIAGDHLIIFNATDHPEAAWKWVEFVSAPDHMLELNVGTPDYPSALLPPRQSLLDDPTLYETRPYMQGFKENMECAFIPKADQPKYYDLQQFLGENLGRAFYGEMTGTEAVVDAAKKGEEFLANP
jgi:ABC-type glycerol-3-phosphate transport system substrate-binding protein